MKPRGWSSVLFAVCLLGPACASNASRGSSASSLDILVEKLLDSPRAQQDTFESLVELGSESIPALVGRLDDDRELLGQQLSVSSSRFPSYENVAHYGPQTVHDALSLVLNGISHQSFIFVYNGSNRLERSENSRAWRVWCREKFPVPADECGY